MARFLSFGALAGKAGAAAPAFGVLAGLAGKKKPAAPVSSGAAPAVGGTTALTGAVPGLLK